MNRGPVLSLILLFCLTAAVTCYADQTIVAKKVAQAPTVDGNGTDEVWARATGYTIHDKAANINLTLKAVYTDSRIFFLVSYPDADRSDTHKTWRNFSARLTSCGLHNYF